MPHWSETALKVAADFFERVEERMEALTDPPRAEAAKPEPVTDVKEGDWVLVYGLVTKVYPALKEVTVRFESHNEHYEGGITTAHLDSVVNPPPGNLRCTDLFEVSGSIIRCNYADEHQGNHRGGNGVRGYEWDNSMTTGYYEVK